MLVDIVGWVFGLGKCRLDNACSYGSGNANPQIAFMGGGGGGGRVEGGGSCIVGIDFCYAEIIRTADDRAIGFPGIDDIAIVLIANAGAERAIGILGSGGTDIFGKAIRAGFFQCDGCSDSETAEFRRVITDRVGVFRISRTDAMLGPADRAAEISATVQRAPSFS